MSNIKSHINSTKFLLKDMCYSVDNNFIYMKPAKTAGTTIYRRMFRLDVVKEGTASEGARLPPYKQEPKKQTVKGMGLVPDCSCQKDDKVKFDTWWSNLTNEEIKNDYFKFVFVRNPFDRLVSAYSHLREDITWSSYRKTPMYSGVRDPRVPGVGSDADEYLIIECYRKLDPTVWTDVYNDFFLKKYATQLIKKQWGANLIKFNGVQMLGGVTMNGEMIYTQAQEEIIRLEEEMRLTYEMPIDFAVG